MTKIIEAKIKRILLRKLKIIINLNFYYRDEKTKSINILSAS
jgi:hypothetical protein